jgi:hypothetical protein
VFNAGRQIGPVPARIELDTTVGAATWTSLMGSESVSLTAPAGPDRVVF